MVSDQMRKGRVGPVKGGESDRGQETERKEGQDTYPLREAGDTQSLERVLERDVPSGTQVRESEDNGTCSVIGESG